jgi:DNA end-binding protein Ku
LRQIIDAKVAGEDVVAPETQDPPKVVDLMEALRRSLDAVSAEKKKPAKAALKKGKVERAVTPRKRRAS